MNKQFYEFWGNYFLQLARGQQQIENLSALMKQGISGMNDLAALFRRSYGLTAPSTADNESETRPWQNAMADFQRSANQLAALWGWVPQAEHQRVVQDLETLKKKVKEQEAVIGHLRDLLNQEGRGHTMLVDHLKRSLDEQSQQFQSLMESIRKSYSKDD